MIQGKKSKLDISKLRIVYFAVIGVLLLSAVGYFAYTKINPKAKAAGWTTIDNNTNYLLKACKQYMSHTYYGPLYAVRAVFTRRNSSLNTVGVGRREDGGKYVSGSKASFGLGNTLELKAYLSTLRKDTFGYEVYFNGKGGVVANRNYSPSQITNC